MEWLSEVVDRVLDYSSVTDEQETRAREQRRQAKRQRDQIQVLQESLAESELAAESLHNELETMKSEHKVVSTLKSAAYSAAQTRSEMSEAEARLLREALDEEHAKTASLMAELHAAVQSNEELLESEEEHQESSGQRPLAEMRSLNTEELEERLGGNRCREPQKEVPVRAEPPEANGEEKESSQQAKAEEKDKDTAPMPRQRLANPGSKGIGRAINQVPRQPHNDAPSVAVPAQRRSRTWTWPVQAAVEQTMPELETREIEHDNDIEVLVAPQVAPGTDKGDPCLKDALACPIRLESPPSPVLVSAGPGGHSPASAIAEQIQLATALNEALVSMAQAADDLAEDAENDSRHAEGHALEVAGSEADTYSVTDVGDMSADLVLDSEATSEAPSVLNRLSAFGWSLLSGSDDNRSGCSPLVQQQRDSPPPWSPSEGTEATQELVEVEPLEVEHKDTVAKAPASDRTSPAEPTVLKEERSPSSLSSPGAAAQDGRAAKIGGLDSSQEEMPRTASLGLSLQLRGMFFAARRGRVPGLPQAFPKSVLRFRRQLSALDASLPCSSRLHAHAEDRGGDELEQLNTTSASSTKGPASEASACHNPELSAPSSPEGYQVILMPAQPVGTATSPQLLLSTKPGEDDLPSELPSRNISGAQPQPKRQQQTQKQQQRQKNNLQQLQRQQEDTEDVLRLLWQEVELGHGFPDPVRGRISIEEGQQPASSCECSCSAC